MEQYIPLIIISTGGLIAFLIVVYYATKEFARVAALHEIAKDKIDEDVEYQMYKAYTIHFRNGSTYKFGGVNLIVTRDEDDPNTVTSFEYGYDEDIDEMSDTEYRQKYSQQLRFIDYSEILFIEQKVHSTKV